jgi:probable HAF family extracellular repeat protein
MTFQSRFVLAALFITSSLTLSTPANAATWSFLDLGTLGGSGNLSFAQGINDSGQVVGYSSFYDGSQHAFITGANGVGMTDLGSLGGGSTHAFGINTAGQAVGDTRTGQGPQQAYITGANGGGMNALVALNGRISFAQGINDSGQVIGSYETGSGYHAYITSSDGAGVTDLGTLGGSFSSALGVNNSGQVVGYSAASDGNNHAFITGVNGVGLIDLGGRNSVAYDINNAGQVVGSSTDSGAGGHAFITGANGVGKTDLGTLNGDSSGSAYSVALGINNYGLVVGYASSPYSGQRHAFITGANGVGMTDLNSLVTIGNGDYLTQATGINDFGQITVISNQGHSFLFSSVAAVPEPETYSLMLIGLCFISFSARRKH